MAEGLESCMAEGLVLYGVGAEAQKTGRQYKVQREAEDC